ncbi:MAG: diguanylate cyclase [Bacillota bacterium]
MNRMINLDFYKLIFENSNDAIFLTNSDGNIYRANKSACEMFELTENEIIKAGIKGIIDTDDTRFAIALKEQEETGKTKVELTCLRKDNKSFPGLINSASFTDKKNNKWNTIIITDLTEYKDVQNSLIQAKQNSEYLATHDYLTGILNRRGFITKANDIIENIITKDDICAFLLLDIDYFKEVNDNFGHIKADNILREFARYLSSNIDNDVLLGRYGGDEFIILLNNITNKQAINEAKRIKDMIYKKDFFLDKDIVKLTVSIGIAFCTYDMEKDIDTIISLADTNMYKAKRNRNSIYW